MLTLTHPALLAEWDDDRSPETVVAGSAYKASWKCAQGHEWLAEVRTRANRGYGCPYCAGKKVLAGYNDLATENPALAAEWHPSKNDRAASEVTAGSGYKAWWKCNRGHEWRVAVHARAREGNGCRSCPPPVVPGRSLAEQRPDVAKEWHPTLNTITPDAVSVGATQYAWWKCKRGHEWRAQVYTRGCANNGCPDCNARNFVSQFESEVADFVRNSTPHEVQTSVRRFKGQGISELDIYIPALNLAIEANGVYWHSEACGRGNLYHKHKLDACTALGIRLIQIWEDDWKTRRAVIEKMLVYKLSAGSPTRVSARDTTVITVDRKTARSFLEENHIQGAADGSLHLGLTHPTHGLVAVMTVKRMTAERLRLERYATSLTVRGGHSKLMAHLVKNVPAWKDIITFADHEVSDGALYEATGWVKDGELAPDYKYAQGLKRYHKFGYRLARFRNDPTLKYQDGLTEKELARLNGLYRVWDSGKTRYIYRRAVTNRIR